MNDMLVFNEFIRRHSLMELPIKGRSYKWSTMQQNPLLEQPEWQFTSLNWSASLHNTVVMPLGEPMSDHAPCYRSIESFIPKEKNSGLRIIGLATMAYLKHEEILNEHCFSHNSTSLLCKKLKNLRYALKHWSKGISKLTTLIGNSNRALLELDGIEEKRLVTLPEANFRIILKKQLLDLLNYKKIYWMKRCTVSHGEVWKEFHSIFAPV